MARKPTKALTVGLISDTHGLLRPEALDALKGVTRIVHAGDIGSPDVLQRLSQIAPVSAVRGNIDTASWSADVPEELELRIGSVSIYVIHNVRDLKFDPAEKGYDVVIAGHSHMPGIARRANVLFVNPGSAGPRRFKLPVAMAYLHISRGAAEARIVHLTL